MGKRQYDMTARRARAAATKERIEAAALALYRQRSLEDFTLEDVAERAETTVLAALTAMAAAGTPVRQTPPGDVAAAVAAIYDVYETIGDFVIGQLADERRRPGLKPALDAGRENHREWVRQLFAPQLNSRRGAARTQLFNILVVALDVYVWKLLRRDLALGRSASRAAVRTIIAGVVDAENTDGTNPLAELVGRR